MSKLFLEQVNTYHVDWLTYAHRRKEGKLGLADHLARCMGLPEGERLDLFEAGNDTQYLVHVKLGDFDKKEIWVKDRQETWDNAIKNKGFEHWRFHNILFGALERGFIPAGWYVVNYSY